MICFVSVSASMIQLESSRPDKGPGHPHHLDRSEDPKLEGAVHAPSLASALASRLQATIKIGLFGSLSVAIGHERRRRKVAGTRGNVRIFSMRPG